MKTIEITTRARTQAVDLTDAVQEVVSKAGLSSGVVIVCSAHTTAGISINENADPDVMADFLEALDRLIPRNGPYNHSEGNSDAHIKSALIGHSVSLPVEEGKLILGTWQAIYFCEFDGPRQRRVSVQILWGK